MDDLLELVFGKSHWDRLSELEREIAFAENPTEMQFKHWTYGLELVFNMHSSMMVENEIKRIYRLLRSHPGFIEWELQQPDDNDTANQENQNQCSVG